MAPRWKRGGVTPAQVRILHSPLSSRAVAGSHRRRRGGEPLGEAIRLVTEPASKSGELTPCEFDPRPLRLEGAPPVRQQALKTCAGLAARRLDTSIFRWPLPNEVKGTL
jgi:hypothetical protein